MWNLEKWYRRTYLQGRSRDADAEDGFVDMVEGRGKWDQLGEQDLHIYFQGVSR